jgi:hypothetical protein
MSFRFVKFYALFVAGLLPGGCLLAQTNSAPAEQPIIFSSPDGQTVSNDLLPAVEAPAPSALTDMPSEIPPSLAYPHGPVARLPAPALMPIERSNSQRLLDAEGTGLATPSEIMGVPTLQEIFGLPKPYTTYDEKSGSVNPDTAGPARPPVDFSAVSSVLPNDDQPAHHEATPDFSVFNSSPFGQTSVEQPAFNQSGELSKTPMLASVPVFSQNTSSANSAFAQGLNSASPFAIPGTLPQVPSVPAINNAAPAPASTPSWAPKPPPWLSQTPAFGTMGQRNF